MQKPHSTTFFCKRKKVMSLRDNTKNQNIQKGYTMIRRSLALGFEAIDGGEGISPVEGTVTDGIAVDDVIEAGEGGEETGALATDIETVSATIEDMLGVDEGLEEKVEEVANVDASEVTGDTVVAAMEALSQAIAISGVDFQKSSIGFESIGSNPSRALSVALEDYKDFFKRLWVQIKEFFKKLMLGFKKIFVAVMKWTAADVDACDKLIKKIKEGGEVAAISQKDGTIFKSTQTKVQKALAGYLAAADHKDLTGAGFVSGLTAILKEVNDTVAFTDSIKIIEAVNKGEEGVNPLSGANMGYKNAKMSNFADAPAKATVQCVFVSSNGLTAVTMPEDLTNVSAYGATTKLAVKSDFVKDIKVDKVGANELIKVLTVLKGHVQNNKKYFVVAEKSIEGADKVVEAAMKKLEGVDEAAQKWAKVCAKVGMRIAKNGIYDSILAQIKANKAVLSVCKTIATGSADKEEKK